MVRYMPVLIIVQNIKNIIINYNNMNNSYNANSNSNTNDKFNF